MNRLLIFFLALPILLSGCSFHLKQPLHLAPEVNQFYIDTDTGNNAFAVILKRTLRNNGITVTDNRSDAKNIIKITGLTSRNNMLNNGGIATSGIYQVDVALDFTLLDAAGKVLVPTTHLTRSQSFMSNATQVLNANSTINGFTQSMQQGLADEVVNALAKALQK